MYTTISQCRVCGNRNLDTVVNLGEQYLTGRFPKSESEDIKKGSLEVVKCCQETGCGLTQLRNSYDLEEMYGETYGYRSGLNNSMVKHLESKIEKIMNMQLLDDGDLVIDIGSNDGTSLNKYPEKKYKLIGIDPSGLKFKKYYNSGIKLIGEFFSSKLIRGEVGGRKAKVITSFSMFYDLENPIAFCKEIEEILDDEGIWVLEQSYLPAMLKANSFDTICHEHMEFYALKQMNYIMKEANLKVLDVEFNNVNGGSFSLTVSKMTSKRSVNEKLLKDVLESEKKYETLEAFSEFNGRVETAKNEMLFFLEEAKKSGKKVMALGASTKGNVLLQYYGIDRNLISVIGEVNKDKFNCFTPGTLIPLVSESEVIENNPDYIVILPWHFRDFFNSLTKLKGKKLIYPLPFFEIVEN